jgi:F-type H+-transporting ATPase subunit epsilon
MTLKLISAEQVIFDGEVSSVTLPGTMGRFTVLNNHASLISTLSAGNISYTDAEGQRVETPIESGLADIDNNIVSVCIY